MYGLICESTIRAMKERAYAGSTSDALELVRLAARYLHPSEQDRMPEELRLYLCASLTRIARETPPTKALNLNRKRGRPKGQGKKGQPRHDHFEIAIRVHNSPHGLHESENGAYFNVAEELGLCMTTIETAYKQHKASLESLFGARPASRQMPQK